MSGVETERRGTRAGVGREGLGPRLEFPVQGRRREAEPQREAAGPAVGPSGRRGSQTPAHPGAPGPAGPRGWSLMPPAENCFSGARKGGEGEKGEGGKRGGRAKGGGGGGTSGPRPHPFPLTPSLKGDRGSPNFLRLCSPISFTVGSLAGDPSDANLPTAPHPRMNTRARSAPSPFPPLCRLLSPREALSPLPVQLPTSLTPTAGL